MKVEIWSDIACPFCYLGKHHFDEAVKSLPGDAEVDVEWKSFELDPNAERDIKEDLYTKLANKYGRDREWAVESSNAIADKGKALGLEFNMDKIVPTNTFDAHRLLHLAKSKGKQIEAEEALFEAYFRDGKHVGNHEDLIAVGKQIGLEEKDVKSMLSSDQFAEEVREDEALSREFRISGVPFFVINRKYGISGAQPVEHFVQMLSKAQNEEKELIMDTGEKGEACGVDGCD